MLPNTETDFPDLISLLQTRARQKPDAPAYTFLLDGGEGQAQVTLSELDARARDIAARLQLQGATGERVLLLYPPGIDYIAGFFGCLYAGAIAVPVYPPRLDRPLTRFLSILDDAEPKFALATEMVCSMVEGGFGDDRSLQWLATDTLDGSAIGAWKQPSVNPKTLAFLQYTSGSTANPKGVMVSHGNLLHNQKLIQNSFGTEPTSRVVGWLPLYHDMGLIGNVLHPLYLGTSCVLLSPLEFLREPRRWLQAIHDFKGTVSGGPNFAFDLCVRKVSPAERAKLDLSRWTIAFNGAEPIREETIERFCDAFAVSGFRRQAFVPCYGLAEATLLVTGGKAARLARWFKRPDLKERRAVEATEAEADARPLIACGEANGVRVVDPERTDALEEGNVGEIWVRNDSVAGGYWRRPDVTEATFNARTRSGEGPFLRTGDLGFIRDGQLFVTGRIKDLLIIRGRNHYPQDLELSAEKSHSALRPGCGAAFAIDADGEERLVFVSEVISADGLPAQEVIDAVRRAIAAEHELQIHAVVLIAPRSIPKTSSGKIQRGACREAFLSGQLEVLSEQVTRIAEGVGALAPSPGDDVPAWLAAQVARRLGVASVELDSAVSSLALDSLQIVELTQEIEDALGARVGLESFFGSHTLRQLAERIQKAERPSLPAPLHQATPSDAPLSEGQRALWLLNQLTPESAAYNVSSALRVRGALDVPALQRAFTALAERHPILRTTFPAVAGEPVQRIESAKPIPFAVQAIASGDPSLTRHLNEEATRPFRLESDLPVRIRIVELGADDHVLMVTFHHLVTDFWSQGLLLHELAAIYAAEKQGRAADLPPIRASFYDYVRWQTQLLSGAEGDRLTTYWLEQLAGPLPALELPTRRRPMVQSFLGAAHSVTLDADLTADLKRLAQEQQATPFMLLLAAFSALLHRYTGQEDIVVGTVATGRTHGSFADVPGYFVNPLPLRSRPRGNQRFDALLNELKQTVLGALEHQGLPFTTLVQRLRPARDPSRSPVFQAMFVLQKDHSTDVDLTGFAMNVAGSRLPWADLVLEAMPLEQHIAQFDLTLTAGEVDGKLHASFDYCTDLFDPPTIAAMADHFRNLLQSLVRSPSVRLTELSLLSTAEIRTQVSEWNETAQPFPQDATVHEWIERQNRQTPNAVALIYGAATLTRSELDRRSNQLAHRLVREGARPESVIALRLERGVDWVVAMLAVLKTGAAFLPLDPQNPNERILEMARSAGAALMLTQDPLAGPTAGEVRTLSLDGLELSKESALSLGSRASPQNLACIIYTSGSTGRPKGTMIDHRALVNLVASFLECYRPSPTDRILPVTSIASVSFVGEVLPLLCAGGALVIPSREEMLDEGRLQELIASSGVTILSTLPSRLSTLRSAEQVLAKVKWVLSGGEALSSEALPHLSSTTQLVNGYGLTETGACSTYYPVPRGSLAPGRAVPLGKPIRNTQLYVLDRHFACVPLGCAGELFIGGDSLARGYLGVADATAERFVPSPFVSGARMYRTGDQVRWGADGNLEFLGRLDHQVKVRGHRIELEEIEATLRQHPSVRESVVTAWGERSEERQLVAHFVAAPEAKTPANAELLSFLRERLPEHMVPAFFMALEALPLLPNGKVNRAALPVPDGQRPELASAFVAPRGELERLIAQVWKVALKVDEVGMNDNFFDLGGHSLLLAKVHAELKEQLKRPLTLVDLFRFPTVGSLAAHLNRPSSSTLAPAERTSAGPVEKDEPIAIIGMAGRFPGATNPDRLWENLTHSVESITFFTDEELLAAGVEPEMVKDPNYVKANGVIGNVDQFDAGFFSLSPRETELMDPQHRVFLECAWECVERAGYDASRYPGRVGVFAGSSMNTYMIMNLLPHMKLVASVDTLQASLGNDKDLLTSRISYKLGLKGPSITIQSASSTSLVAVHVACQALRGGTCEMALAGGVSIHVPETSGYMYHEGGTTAIDGHCRAFDADASGFVSGKGAGIVLLKRLSDAVRDGDHVHAVIRGSACNNDGALKVSYTAPSVEGQVDLYRQAMADAGVQPHDFGYIECHGTGTAMGDPIEITALTEAFGSETLEAGSCAIGSLKTNIGHLDTAAGVCGLIKAALCVEHGQLVPTLHFKKANPEIDFESTPFKVNTALRDFGKSPRIAGVTSLGMGGTNAHVILGEGPTHAESGPSRRHQLLVLSAKTPTALATIASNLASHLESGAANLADVAFVLQAGRRAFKHRRAIVCGSREEAISALRTGQGSAGIFEGGDPAIAFMFPGQGSQYVQMGRGLYDSEPSFRRDVDEMSAALVPELGFDLRQRIYPGEGADVGEATQALSQTRVTQPALFVIEYAMARLLISWGIQPQALLGHSVGELVAACVAGVFSLSDALSVVAARGRLMQQMAPGSMLAVPMTAEAIQPRLNAQLCIAAVNEPASCVVAGPSDAIASLQEALAASGITSQRLQTSHAFHSFMLDDAMAPFRARVALAKLSAPRLPFMSNVTGTWITDAQATDPDYWATQMRQAVRFGPAVAELLREPSRVCVEVGPGHTLAGFVRRHPARKPKQEAITLMRHPKETDDDQSCLLRGVGKLWNAGARIDAGAFFAGEQRRRLALPTYPFERKRYWVDGKPLPTAHPVAQDVRQPEADWYFTSVWKQAPRPNALDSAAPRQSMWVLAEENEASSRLVEELRNRNHEVIVLRPRAEFARLSETELAIDPTGVADYERVFDSMPAPTRVIYMSSSADAFFSPISLMQAFGRRPGRAVFELVVVTQGVQDVTGAETLQPMAARALGPCRVIPLEYPGVRCRNIDLPHAADAGLAKQVVAEILSARAEPEVALRGGRRWVQSFEKVALGGLETGLHRLRPGGVYLLTGGLGGMALAIAEELAKRERAKLVLMSRTALPSRSEWAAHPTGRKLIALEAHGAEVEVVTGDVGRAADVGAALARTRERFGALHGVIHTAGVPGGGLIQLRQRAASEAVFAGKLGGALELDVALRGQSLDFVVLCSSLTAVVSMPGQADYVAANAGLDALAAARAREGLPWLSINWDAWRETGMAARLDAAPELGAWRNEMLRDGLSNAEGAESFIRALGSGLSQVLVSTHPLSARLEARRGLDATPAAPVVPVNLGNLAQDEVEQRIAAVWQELLGVPEVGPHDNFFELGGTSLMGIKILARLRSELGVEISEVGLFQAPTVSTLAGLIRNAQTPSAAADEAQARGARRREKRRGR